MTAHKAIERSRELLSKYPELFSGKFTTQFVYTLEGDSNAIESMPGDTFSVPKNFKKFENFEKICITRKPRELQKPQTYRSSRHNVLHHNRHTFPKSPSDLPPIRFNNFFQAGRCVAAGHAVGSEAAPLAAKLPAGEFDIVALSETWLHQDVLSSELFPSEYEVYRNDRNFAMADLSTGGGVLLDMVACKCTTSSHTTLYVLTLYVPPSTSIEVFELLFEYLEQADFLQSKHVVIMGDFNVPNFVNQLNADSKTFVINNFMNFFDFHQLNNILNSHHRLLDLIISNVACKVVHDNAPLLREDAYHPALIINLYDLSSKESVILPNDNKCYNFKKANYPELYNTILETDWSYLINLDDINDAVHEFYRKLYEIFDAHVPLYRNFKHKYPHWYNSIIIKNIKKKAKALKKYKRTHNNIYLEEFKTLRSTIKEQVRAAYDNYISEIQSDISHAPKQFWSFIHSKNRTSRIPGEMTYENILVNDPQNIVNTFGNFFNSVFTVSNDNFTPSETYRTDGIYPARGIAYTLLINRFDIVSLDLRRRCALLTFLYKILHNQINCPELLAQLNFYVPRLCTRNNLTFYCTAPRTNMLLKSPIYVMCDNYNKLCHICDINFCNVKELIQKAIQWLDDDVFT
ncbi:hypothetical protein NQ317_008322 [Molorchus minor]|uniref:Endonuclease/exonuclease/phosphatase domain-containing protein n=1 Tax=Molorchus minor TaxID=1323400 RepID=A0ABQ9JTC4_9CUCU|nr:hypothetical protein NQ317_008322 [Molorchus minor]